MSYAGVVEGCCFLGGRPPQCGGEMLKAGEEEIESIREYFEWQAPDLEGVMYFCEDRS
jgi:hypothetical protein